METGILIFEDVYHYVWSKKGEACRPQNIIPTMKYRGGSIMLWDGFSAGGTDEFNKNRGYQ